MKKKNTQRISSEWNETKNQTKCKKKENLPYKSMYKWTVCGWTNKWKMNAEQFHIWNNVAHSIDLMRTSSLYLYLVIRLQFRAHNIRCDFCDFEANFQRYLFGLNN